MFSFLVVYIILTLVIVLAISLFILNRKIKEITKTRDQFNLKDAEVRRLNQIIVDLKNQMQRQEERYKKDLLLNYLNTIESKKKEIGSNMHDFLGSMLWAIKVQLEIALRTDQFNEMAAVALNRARDIMDETLNSVRNVVQELVPKTLLMNGISAAIQEHCSRITSDYMKFEFSEDTTAKISSQKLKYEVLLFRVIQEILNNCLKYSKAKIITVNFMWGVDLFITIINDGITFQFESPQDKTKTGLGLYTIPERIKVIGGSIESDAGPPNTIQISIPMYDEYKSYKH